MSKTPALKLAPVVAKTAKTAATLAQQDGRKRPIIAINEDGKLVVCCRRTAKKNGWQIHDVLYERSKTTKAETPAPTPEASAKTPTPEASAKTPKKTPKNGTAPKAKEFVDDHIDDILGN
jgi:hypothetical protein